ncbi:MAG TPA: NADH-quinone oxidoreductase subunit N [Saprospiraceae bacterium]|nr:NADH-quinone oxidoreductase subunit N [Saprospiraceae bacterium]
MMLSLIILTVFSIAILFLGFTRWKNILVPLSFLALSGALWSIFTQQTFWNQYLMDMVELEGSSRLMSMLVLVLGLGLVPFFQHFQGRGNEELADFLGIFLFSLVGGLLMVSAVNYMSLFLGVEILTISMYVLAGADRRKSTSNEASLKYFITGSFTSALMLFGIGLLYTATGTLSIRPASNVTGILIPGADASWIISHIGFLFLFVSFALKIAIVPFHFWAPDVYQGTPTLFTAAMSTVVKVAAFGMFFRVVQLNAGLLPEWINWFFILMILATLVYGNLMAMGQRSVKRLLAYSGIVQAGFILIGFIQLNGEQLWPLLFYFMAYSLASLVCFLVIHFVEGQSGTDDIDSFGGLAYSNPSLAAMMTIALISLAGGPLTAGFMAKIFMLNHAIQNGYTALVIVAVITTLMSFYYYYKIINAMFTHSGDQAWRTPFLYRGIMALLIVITLAAGVFPAHFIQYFR